MTGVLVYQELPWMYRKFCAARSTSRGRIRVCERPRDTSCIKKRARETVSRAPGCRLIRRSGTGGGTRGAREMHCVGEVKQAATGWPDLGLKYTPPPPLSRYSSPSGSSPVSSPRASLTACIRRAMTSSSNRWTSILGASSWPKLVLSLRALSLSWKRTT